MARFEQIALEKGMYHVPGKTFTQVLEELDSSENYRGTPWRAWTPSSGS